MSDTPKTDMAARRIGAAAARWQSGEINAVSFADAVDRFADAVAELERENATLREVGNQLCATLEVELRSIEAVAIAFGDEGSGHCKQLQAVIEKWRQVVPTAIDAARKEAQT